MRVISEGIMFEKTNESNLRKEGNYCYTEKGQKMIEIVIMMIKNWNELKW